MGDKLLGQVVSTQMCLCYRRDVDNCMAEKRRIRTVKYEYDLECLGDAIRKVMQISGIDCVKCQKATNAIKNAFMHYDEVRYRIDRVPKKRLCKEDLIHDLALDANMTHIETHLTYSIVKRAFKAYFYGTGVHGRRTKTIIQNMKHRQDCLWLHAAVRTAQVIAAYRGLMYSEQKQYEAHIRCAYKALFDQLMATDMYDDELVCTCNIPLDDRDSINSKDEIPNNTSNLSLFAKTSKFPGETAELYASKRSTFYESSISSNTQHRETAVTIKGVVQKNERNDDIETTNEEKESVKCKCPPLTCLPKFEHETLDITAECSQGPYICRWLPLSEDDETLPCKPTEEKLICKTCKSEDDEPCDSECTCSCEYCECEELRDYIEEASELRGEEFDTDIEDYDSDFIYVAPLHDETTQKPEVDLKQSELEQHEYSCESTCQIGQMPEAEYMNYVAPLSDRHINDDPEEQIQEETNAILMKTPVGISLATIRCYQDDKRDSVSNDGRPRSSRKRSTQESNQFKKNNAKLETTFEPIENVLEQRRKSPVQLPTDLAILTKSQHGADKAAAPVNRNEKRNSPKIETAATKPATSANSPPTRATIPTKLTDQLTKNDILDIIGI